MDFRRGTTKITLVHYAKAIQSQIMMNYQATRVNKEPRLLLRMNTNKARNHQHKLLHLHKTPLNEDPETT